MWAKAEVLCRLNMDDIRKAKELGLNPQSLIKNIPSSSQKWKAPVKVWIQELYEKRSLAPRSSPKPSAAHAPIAEPNVSTEALTEIDSDD